VVERTYKGNSEAVKGRKAGTGPGKVARRPGLALVAGGQNPPEPPPSLP